MAYKEVLSVSINDDGNLFVACTESGIRVYNIEPLVGKLSISSSQLGSFSICKLLHRTQLLALVSGGNRQKYAENSVLIWDDAAKEFVSEFIFETKVLSVIMRRDRIFVVERNRIHCFSFPNNPKKKLFTIETGDNPNGMCEVTPLTHATELQLLAYPGHRVGTVQLLDLSTTSTSTGASQHHRRSASDADCEADSDASVSYSPTSINAHQSDIACIALNRSGTLLASASRKGTLIRIFRTTDATALGRGSSYIPLSPEKVAEFRRGMDPVTVYCIAFSHDSEYVLASSDKGTVHIFCLSESRFSSRRSALSAVPVLVNLNLNVPYSMSKFTLPAECACVCTFGPDRKSVYAICVDGTFHKYLLNKDGSCTRDDFVNYLTAQDETDSFFY